MVTSSKADSVALMPNSCMSVCMMATMAKAEKYP